jgi:glycosyltransferase involved in cell wall biosynthesis
MRFSIVTPSFRQSDWLRLCVASVADQNVPLEHIVQDPGSEDGTLEWARVDKRIKLFVEKDAGMYDAVNRGFRRASGSLLAYLNCDEQYLPGTLQTVAGWFDVHPDMEVVFGDIIKVDGQGRYLSHRKMQTPLLHHTLTCHLSTLTCGTFFRRSIFDRGFAFDPSWRTSGDGEWMVRMLRAGVKMGVLGTFTSVFVETGENLSRGALARSEALRLRQTAPAWARVAKPLIVLHHRFRRLFGGMYNTRPFTYEIYTKKSPGLRERFEAARE